MSKRIAFGLALGLAAAAGIGRLVTAEPAPAVAEEAKVKAEPAPGKGPRALAFIAAFDRGDAKALAEFWTPEGDYVDQSGRAYKGRAAIEKLYERFFAAHKGAKLTIHADSIRMVGTDAAIEEGSTEVAWPDSPIPSAAHFTAVIAKKDGAWYFESVHDTLARPPSNVERFDDLAWLIGDWVGEEAKGESSTASYAWADNRNFIVSTFATTLNGVPVVGGTQWIGWDAIDKKVRSWSFYSRGGFGEAAWSLDGGKWTVKTSAKTADGKKVSATNTIAKIDDDHLNWQVSQLTVDGNPVPDPAMVKMKRVKAGP